MEAEDGREINQFIEPIQGSLRDKYRIGNVIGEGAFGQVREIRFRDNLDEVRAVKILTKAKMSADEHTSLKNEFNNLKNLDHPNILKMYELYEDDKRYYIVTEKCDGGELFDNLMDRGGSISEKDVSQIMKTVLSCINYCHSNKIAHRDLKPENILLEKNKDFHQLKVIDFGTSVSFD